MLKCVFINALTLGVVVFADNNLVRGGGQRWWQGVIRG